MKKVIVFSVALMLLTGCAATKRVFHGGSEPQAAAPGQLPETVRDEFNKGVEAYNEEKYVNAQQHFQNVTRVNPNIPEAHLDLALSLYRQGKIDEAGRHFDQAKQLLSKEGMGGAGAGGGQPDTSGQR